MSKTIAAAVDAAALRFPSRLALTSPFQSQRFTYQELQTTTKGLAVWLSKKYGFEKHDLLVSDLPNVSENLLLQIACNRLGVGYGTAKDSEGLAKFPKVKGAVSTTGTGFLAETNLPFPYLSGDFLVDLIQNGLHEYSDSKQDWEGQENHGFYNTTTPYSNQQALRHGQETMEQLDMTENDIVCVSITLCHAFGMGSSVCAALQSGAAIALPAVGGIQGCGVPTQRAAATLDVLQSEQCTLLMADTHTLKAMPVSDPTMIPLSLRGGVCKIGSGSAFLEETRSYAGVTLKTVGKAT